jgi:hypothetical protein
MKMVNNFPGHNNWKRIDIRLVSLAGGLALTTAALVGGSQIL